MTAGRPSSCQAAGRGRRASAARRPGRAPKARLEPVQKVLTQDRLSAILFGDVRLRDHPTPRACKTAGSTSHVLATQRRSPPYADQQLGGTRTGGTGLVAHIWGSQEGGRRRCSVAVGLLLVALLMALIVPESAWAADTSPPTGTVVINGGAAATNIRTVTLTLAATDALSTVTQMRFSNTGSSFSAAETYATTKTWTLSSGAGHEDRVRAVQGCGRQLVVTFRSPTRSCSTTRRQRSRRVPPRRSRAVPPRSPGPPTRAPPRRSTTGSTTSYGSTTPLDPALVVSHSVPLSGLVGEYDLQLPSSLTRRGRQ